MRSNKKAIHRNNRANQKQEKGATSIVSDFSKHHKQEMTM